MKASIINSILYYGMVRGIAEVGGGVPTRWSETSTIVGNIIELCGELGSIYSSKMDTVAAVVGKVEMQDKKGRRR